MSTLKVDTIAANAAGSISVSSPLAVTQAASITGSLTTTAISSTGTISTTGELDGATLDISGNGELDGQLNVGSLLVQGNLSTSGILVDGEEMRPYVFAFGGWGGTTLSGAKNCTAVVDSAGTLTVTFTTAAPDANYVVLSTTRDSASPVQIAAKTTSAFEIRGVPTAGVDFLVAAMLGSQAGVTAALPAVTLDNLTDVDLTGLSDDEVLVYDAASGKFKPEPAATGTGTVTQIVAGTGLTGGTITGSGTIAHQAQPTGGTGPAFVKSIEIDALGHVASVTGDTDASGARGTLGLGDSATKSVGTTSGTVCAGDDSRLTDARTPTAHTQALSTITDAGTSASLDVASSGDATSSQVVKGNDTRLTDARTPVAHSAALITSGTLAIAQGGTGSATAPMVGVITAADAAAARTVLSLGTAATSATGDFVASSAVSTFGGTLIDDADAAAARTTLALGNAAILDTGAGNTDLLKCGANVTQGDFLRINAFSELVEGRTNAEVLSDIGAFAASGVSSFGATLIDDADAAAARTTLGAQATLTSPVTSPAMTGVSAGSITGVIKCSQSQYDAITPDANTLYVIV